MRTARWLAAVAVGSGALLGAGAARAEEPLVWTVTTTSGTPETVRVGGDRLVRLTDDVILGRGAAAPLAGRDVVATLNYAGVPDALRLTLPADRASATLAYPRSGGGANTFSATGSSFDSPVRAIDDDVYYTITDPHNRQWRDLQRLINRESYIAPADGNPSAATAFLADQTFRKYGLFPDANPNGPIDRTRQTPGGVDVWFDTLDGSVQTSGFSGYDLRFAVNAAGRFTPLLGWSVSVPFQYRNLGGAESYTGAVEFGLPIDVVRPTRRVPVGWTLTPSVEFGASDSRNLGSTVALFGAGLTSRVGVRLGDWTVTLADQFSGYTDLGADNGGDDYGGYYGDGGYYGGGNYNAFRGNVAQQLFKNGVQVGRRFRYGLAVDASLTYSTFLENAAVDGFFTPRVGVTWQINRLVGLRLAYQADLADHYTAQGGDFAVEFRF